MVKINAAEKKIRARHSTECYTYAVSAVDE